MARIASVRGAPKIIRVDNGPEFISKALDRRAPIMTGGVKGHITLTTVQSSSLHNYSLLDKIIRSASFKMLNPMARH